MSKERKTIIMTTPEPLSQIPDRDWRAYTSGPKGTYLRVTKVGINIVVQKVEPLFPHQNKQTR